MSANLMVNPAQSFHTSPLPLLDVGRQIFQHLTLLDVGSCILVNKSWHETINKQQIIWLTMFDNEKIPAIPSRPNTVKEDFFFMREITFSERQAAPIGKFFGKVPPISENTFKFLKYGKDGFKATKNNDETHVVLVQPTHFIVPYDADLADHFYDCSNPFPNAFPTVPLRAPGDEIEIDEAKTVMKIPYSWFSVMKLAQHYWAKVHPTDKLYDEFIGYKVRKIFKETIKYSETVNVYIMRIIPPKLAKGRNYIIQEQIMKSKGYEVAPFTPIIYFNMLKLFNEGNCPNGSLTMRTSDLIESVDKGLSNALGSKIFEYDNVCIGDANAQRDCAFPMIHTVDQHRNTEDITAAAGFPAELEDFSQMHGGTKRTHETAFSPES